jgi:hypothetical protein
LTFCSPELDIGRRHDLAVSAFVHMKEAPMHIDYLSMPDKHNIRFSWKVFFVKAVAVPQGMNNRSHDHLRPRVATPDPRHVETSLMGG